jgi:predicted DNA-binding protein
LSKTITQKNNSLQLKMFSGYYRGACNTRITPNRRTDDMAFSIRLQKNIEERLERLSALTNRPKSFYVNEALIHGRSVALLETIYLTEKDRESATAESLGHELGREDPVQQLSLV